MAIRNFGKYGRFWEMRQGGPKSKKTREIFKCADCGAETHHQDGFNGEPDVSRCSAHCGSRTDWRPGGVSGSYRDNYDRIFRKGGSL